MRKIVCFVFFTYTSFCYSNMYYISTPYGVLLVDIKGNDFITSIIFENSQLTFANPTTLQLVVTHDPDSGCPSLVMLLASFIDAYKHGNSWGFSIHGDGTPLENNFILFANNYDYLMTTESYEQNDSVDFSQSTLLVLSPVTGGTYPCMFNCPSVFYTTSERDRHYKNTHYYHYEAIRKKYSVTTKCPLCGLTICSFMSLCRHITNSHKGKNFAEF